jgi:DNA repair protein RadC
MIVAHNHPAGSTIPSHADEEVTRLLREAGQTLDIELLDHLIIAQGRWASLREQLRW